MSQYCNCKSPSCTKCSTSPACTVNSGDSVRAVYESLKTMKIDNDCCGKGYCGVSGDGDCDSRRGLDEVNLTNITLFSVHIFIPYLHMQTVPDKLMFIVEWYENQADLVKKYLLIYYGIDGSCEVV